MKNRRWILLAVAAMMAATASAQTAREEMKRDIHRSASNHLAYPGPRNKLTPAPKGMKPFYISHYGRHGSRFLTNEREYNNPYETLVRAERQKKLTPLGTEVLARVERLRAEASGRIGELTPLGALQHKQIARRMYERFPEVFDGDATVDARSTIVIRCILSMENALQQLLVMNPRLRITHDASQHDMYYMNFRDSALRKKMMPTSAEKVFDAFAETKEHPARLMSILFNDTAYVNHHVDTKNLARQLFKLASAAQNTELRRQITLYDIFTDEEIYDFWEKENAWWYIRYGPSPLNGGQQPYSQRNLLRRIIEQADSCIRLPKPGATLRFGHETMVLPLCCLLELNNCGLQVLELDELVKNEWYNYRIFPMGANVQFIFYRSSPEDDNVLFKVLLNEDEATLPLKTSQPPYYRWADFREYYLKKIDDYKD